MCRWMMFIASGSLLLQTTGCQFLEIMQTGFLAGLTGITYYLAANV
jgi:hypothetical protein